VSARSDSFAQNLARHERLWDWLEERGYPDHLAALEAGESGPEGLEDVLREQAAQDPRHRAWARIEAALAAHELPAEADLRLLAHTDPDSVKKVDRDCLKDSDRAGS
jgi:hypothetical protein